MSGRHTSPPSTPQRHRPGVPPLSRRQRPERPATPRNSLPVLYIVVASLVVCSMIAAGLSFLDLGSILGGQDDEVVVDPNADVIAEQETIVAENPDDVEATVLLASMLGNTNRMSEAIPYYERAIEMAPEDHGIRLDYARSLQQNDLNVDAEAQFLKVLDAEPDNIQANYYLAKLYMDWKPERRAEAMELFQHVVDINPDNFLAQEAKRILDTQGQTSPESSPVVGP